MLFDPAQPPSGANVACVVRVDAASRRMLRARDKMDRSYDKPLDVAALARVALTSEAHFIRTFKDTFGETPHRYLQRRRLERAMALLRQTERPVTEICLDVGFTSLGSFSRTFTHVIGMSPTAYREAWRTGAGTAGYVPTCVVMSWTRPMGGPQDSSFGEANRDCSP
jgi:AraC-like DNA-binding protein